MNRARVVSLLQLADGLLFVRLLWLAGKHAHPLHAHHAPGTVLHTGMNSNGCPAASATASPTSAPQLRASVRSSVGVSGSVGSVLSTKPRRRCTTARSAPRNGENLLSQS